MTLEPVNASFRVVESLRSAWKIETPLDVHASALGFAASRVIPRTDQPGRVRKVLATEPPCFWSVAHPWQLKGGQHTWAPVMPRTTMIFSVILLMFPRRSSD